MVQPCGIMKALSIKQPWVLLIAWAPAPRNDGKLWCLLREVDPPSDSTPLGSCSFVATEPIAQSRAFVEWLSR